LLKFYIVLICRFVTVLRATVSAGQLFARQLFSAGIVYRWIWRWRNKVKICLYPCVRSIVGLQCPYRLNYSYRIWSHVQKGSVKVWSDSKKPNRLPWFLFSFVSAVH